MRHRTPVYGIEYQDDQDTNGWLAVECSQGRVEFFSAEIARHHVVTVLAQAYPGRMWRTVKRMPFHRTSEPTGWVWDCREVRPMIAKREAQS